MVSRSRAKITAAYRLALLLARAAGRGIAGRITGSSTRADPVRIHMETVGYQFMDPARAQQNRTSASTPHTMLPRAAAHL